MFVSGAHTTAATQKWWHCGFFFSFFLRLILSTYVASRPQQLKQQIEQEVLEKDLIIVDHSKLNAMLQRRCRSIFLLCHISSPSSPRHKPSIMFDSACHDEEDLEWSVFTSWTCFSFFHMRRQGRHICIKVQPVPACCHDERGQHNEFPYAGHCCDNRFVWLLRSSQQLGGKKLIQTSAHIVKRGNHYSLIGHTWEFGGGLMHLPPPTTKSRRRRFIQLVSGTPAAARCGSKSFQRTESSRAKKQGVDS